MTSVYPDNRLMICEVSLRKSVSCSAPEASRTTLMSSRLMHLTNVFRRAQNLPELSDCTQSAGQAKVYDLYVSGRWQAGEEDVLWLREEQKQTVRWIPCKKAAVLDRQNSQLIIKCLNNCVYPSVSTFNINSWFKWWKCRPHDRE